MTHYLSIMIPNDRYKNMLSNLSVHRSNDVPKEIIKEEEVKEQAVPKKIIHSFWNRPVTEKEMKASWDNQRLRHILWRMDELKSVEAVAKELQTSKKHVYHWIKKKKK